MISLVGYQLAAFGRSRAWLVLLVGYLTYLALFFLRTVRHHPGAYSDAVPGVLTLAFGLAWTLVAVQDRSLRQLLIVAAGSRTRAGVSRVAAPFVLLVPLALATALVAAGRRLGSADVVAPVLGGTLLYLLAGLLGCIVGSRLGQAFSARSIPPVIVLVSAALLLAL